MLRPILFGVLSLVILSLNEASNKETRTIHLEGLGNIIGEKFWDGEFYEYYGVPYATVPKGRDKYKPPLPPTPWEEDMEAKRGLLICQQVYFSDQDDEEEDALYGIEECLVSTLLVPKIASETNLVPIVIYIHSGGYAGGSGNMAKYYHLARQDVLVVNFNYRVGALGFACLGTEDIPGNAALKDIIALLKFIQKYAKTFGGDPDNVTLAGFSIGASLAEIIALSKESEGLFNKLMLDSGSALSPFAVNRHPIETARNIAKRIGYKDKGNIDDLNEFLLEADAQELLSHSRHFFLKNSTFGFTPCIEKPSNPGAVLTESPIDTIKKGNYGDFPVLIGFADMEGISRTSMFDEWRGLMNQKLEDFLPGDLAFKTDKERDAFVKDVKKYYFNDQPLSLDSIQAYIDYFSDSMFKYSIIKSVKLHAQNLKRPIYLYEFTYVGKLNTKHAYTDKVRGASHRDASAYVLDFYDWTRNYTDLDMRDLITSMWADFIKYENPTPYETSLLTLKWLQYTNENSNYLDIGGKLKMKKDLFSEGYQFWDRVYQKHYWVPTVVDVNLYKKITKADETKPAESKQVLDSNNPKAPADQTVNSNINNKPPPVETSGTASSPSSPNLKTDTKKSVDASNRNIKEEQKPKDIKEDVKNIKVAVAKNVENTIPKQKAKDIEKSVPKKEDQTKQTVPKPSVKSPAQPGSEAKQPDLVKSNTVV